MLAIGAVGAGLVQIPEVDDVITNFLRPTFAGSPLYEPHTRDGLLIFGLCLGTALGLTGIAIAYRIWVKRPRIAVRARERFAPLYELLVQQVVLRRADRRARRATRRAAGRFAQGTFERVFVQDTLIGGSTGIVRAGSAAVRAVQSGFLRYYAALLVLGVDGRRPSTSCCRRDELMPPLSILIWLPAVCGVLGAILSSCSGAIARARNSTDGPSATDASAGGWSIPGVLALIGSVAALGLAIGYIADYSPGTTGLTHVTDVVWISELGIHYKLGISGLNVFLSG